MNRYSKDFQGGPINRELWFDIGVLTIPVSTILALPLIKLPPSIVRFASREYSARILFRIALLAAGLGLGSFAYAADFSISKIIDGLVASRFAAPWSRGQFGGWDAFRDFLGYFTYT